MSNILVTGSGSGLGAAIVEALRAVNHTVFDYDLKHGRDVLHPTLAGLDKLDVLINCAGINRISWLEDLTEDVWDTVMDVNAKGIYKMTRACLDKLKASSGTVLNIVSNASHMPMRCSLAYNASKGAAHIMTQQLARELSPGITVFGISPNKLKGTGMSDDIDEQVMATRGWTKEEAQRYQIAGLLAGEETDPKQLAEFIAYLLSTKQRHKYLTGCVLPYGA